MSGTVSAREWARRFAENRHFARSGSYGVNLPRLSLSETAELMQATGIHEGVLGRLRRAAHELNWFVFVRPVKRKALDLWGDFDKLPKPMAIKAKCHPVTGLVMFDGEDDYIRALDDGRVERAYADAHGLHLDPDPVVLPPWARPLFFLKNRRGQGYYSDMDLYEVINARSGRPVILGTGDPAKPHSGVGRRRELDILINIMRPLGTDFALIDHGPQRQWVKHQSGSPWHEDITAFCPDGKIFVLPAAEVEPFIEQISR